MREIKASFEPGVIEDLTAGEEIALSIPAFTLRDATLKRVQECLDHGISLPFDLEGALVFYAGPTPGVKGKPFGAIGPTTSSRMDGYLEMLFKLGVVATLGKGPRTAEAIEIHKKYKRVYFAATGGLGAFYAERVTSLDIIAWPDLGCEAVFLVKLHRFPVLVAIDSKGNDFFQQEYSMWVRRLVASREINDIFE